MSFNNPTPCLYQIATYIVPFKECIKKGDHKLLYFYKPFNVKNRMSSYGVKWLTPLGVCYMYNKTELINLVKGRLQCVVTMYDLYLLAQLKRWTDVKQMIEQNPEIKFCYQLIYQYALESNAESFITWCRNHPNFVEWSQLCKQNVHSDEHMIVSMRRRYSRMVHPQRGTPWY